jgi:cyclase
MLAKRIIPCLDVHNGRVVKGINFINLRDAGDPVEQARFYDAEGADELVFLDITATHEGRETMQQLARQVADQLFIPFTVGGGLRTVTDMRLMLRAGADKVSLNSAVVAQPELITQGANEFGSQAVVVAIDARRIAPQHAAAERHRPIWLHPDHPLHVDAHSTWEVYVRGGRTPTGIDALRWAQSAETGGAGEILLTSMDCDGVKTGYDLPLTRAVADAVRIPVIASGGAGAPAHFAEALTIGGADAALAASLFHFRELSIPDLKQYLAAEGVPVRPVPPATLSLSHV